MLAGLNGGNLVGQFPRFMLMETEQTRKSFDLHLRNVIYDNLFARQSNSKVKLFVIRLGPLSNVLL